MRSSRGEGEQETVLFLRNPGQGTRCLRRLLVRFAPMVVALQCNTVINTELEIMGGVLYRGQPHIRMRLHGTAVFMEPVTHHVPEPWPIGYPFV